MTRVYSKIFLFVLHTFFLSASFAQTAYLQPQEIYQGDTATLVIEYDGASINPPELDSSALKKDFEIINNSSSMNVIQQDSQVTTRMRWEFELMPLKSGRLEIPPLKVNGSATPKLELLVKEQVAGATDAASNQDIFLQMSADTDKPYVAQQVNITLRLYHNVRIVHGTLSQPEVTGADVYRIGKDINYAQTFNGQQYNVLERSFALFPNAEGSLSIAPVEFRGQTEAPSSSSTSNSTFLRSIQNISRQSGPLELAVRGIPVGYTGKYWLPANDLRLSGQWPDENAALEIGGSAGFSIKLIADGLPGEALPENLVESAGDGASVYPDKAGRMTRDIGKKLIGTLEQQYELIVSKAGEIEIPAITVDWWDVDEDKQKQALISQHRLTVTGNSAPPQADNLPVTTKTTGENSEPGTMQLEQAPLSNTSNPWRWLTLALLVLWLLTLAVWLFSRRKGFPAMTPSQAGPGGSLNSLKRYRGLAFTSR